MAMQYIIICFIFRKRYKGKIILKQLFLIPFLIVNFVLYPGKCWQYLSWWTCFGHRIIYKQVCTRNVQFAEKLRNKLLWEIILLFYMWWTWNIHMLIKVEYSFQNYIFLVLSNLMAQTCRKFKSFRNKHLDFQKFPNKCMTYDITFFENYWMICNIFEEITRNFSQKFLH